VVSRPPLEKYGGMGLCKKEKVKNKKKTGIDPEIFQALHLISKRGFERGWNELRWNTGHVLRKEERSHTTEEGGGVGIRPKRQLTFRKEKRKHCQGIEVRSGIWVAQRETREAARYREAKISARKQKGKAE